MRLLKKNLSCLALTLALAVPFGLAASAAEPREWQFRVYLDDREIGYHTFRLRDLETGRQLETEARFKVKFLFFNAYEYEHVNTERWQGDCLKQIESRTRDNGDEYSVQGFKQPDRFVVSSEDQSETLPPCVMTFAYWNPDFLKQDRLLNSQTGEYLDVSVKPVDTEEVTVRGQKVEAVRYRLSAKEMDLELWYSKDQEWLGLESTTEGGRKLRYVLL